MQATLELALAQAQQEQAQKIHRIQLKIGELAGVIPDALEFAFEVVTAGTIAAGASLDITQLPVICYCTTCDQEFSPEGWIYRCPRCEQLSQTIHQGHELELAAMEIS